MSVELAHCFGSYLSTHSQQIQVHAKLPHLDIKVVHVAVCGHDLVRGDGVIGFGPEFDGEGEGKCGGVDHVAEFDREIHEPERLTGLVGRMGEMRVSSLGVEFGVASVTAELAGCVRRW